MFPATPQPAARLPPNASGVRHEYPAAGVRRRCHDAFDHDVDWRAHRLGASAMGKTLGGNMETEFAAVKNAIVYGAGGGPAATSALGCIRWLECPNHHHRSKEASYEHSY